MGNVVFILANHQCRINLTSWIWSLWFAAKHFVSFYRSYFDVFHWGWYPCYTNHMSGTGSWTHSHTAEWSPLTDHYQFCSCGYTSMLNHKSTLDTIWIYFLHQSCWIFVLKSAWNGKKQKFNVADEDICWLLLFIWSFNGEVKHRIYTVQSRWRVSPGRLCVWSSASCNSAAGMSKWSDSGGDGGVCLISKRGPCLMWQTSKRGACCAWLNDLIGMFVCLCSVEVPVFFLLLRCLCVSWMDGSTDPYH